MHVRATQNTGATPEEVREAFLHVAVHDGVPAANHTIKIAREYHAEMDLKDWTPEKERKRNRAHFINATGVSSHPH